ncbi:transcription factor [Novosphingobium sp. Rr 2-17]|uniref:type II toxin-antitoxin system VapB family antitoxin n=1 Tax=Novosphingobium sp. Rr 2-17 TaxID=555793 RepID=UPI0002699828|nr:type II toxin-antitoxin system VapB family antitoxin [Novosphingobium sp. Rr 2-17]EIZ80439.1 transcription factor [Novosphingobium sp. Rr 2-17]
MGAQMNIKSDEAYAIASELAGKTGTSLTQVVLEALRAHSKRLDREAKIAEIREFCRETAAMMSPEVLAFDIDKELYDEKTGLPK